MKKLARMLIADADDKDCKDADANADVDADDEDWMLMLTTKIGRMLMTVSYFASSRLPRILPGTRSAPSHTHHFLSGTTMMKTVMIMRVMMVMMMTHSQIYGNYNDLFDFLLGNKRESNTQTEILKTIRVGF